MVFGMNTVPGSPKMLATVCICLTVKRRFACRQITHRGLGEAGFPSQVRLRHIPLRQHWATQFVGRQRPPPA